MTTSTELRDRQSLARVTAVTCCFVAAAGIAMLAGCEAPKDENTINQQIAQQVEPVEQRLREQESSTKAAQGQLQQRVSALEATVNKQQARIDDLAARLQSAEGTLAGYAKFDFDLLAQTVDSSQNDLRQLRGELTGHVYTADKQFEDIKLIHANFEQSDEELRKLIASSVTGVERRTAQAQQEANDRVAQRIEEHRTAVASEINELDRQVEAGRARTAQAMQLLGEFLDEERAAIQAHAARLDAIHQRVNQQFDSDAAANSGQ